MVNTAIILAGGFGTRLQSVVSDVPKPMAPVNGIPFLDYQLNYLHYYGIKKIVFAVGYLAEKISERYGESYKGMQVSYVIEKSPLGTGGAIRLAMETCSDQELLVLNGDSFFDVDLKKLYHLHFLERSQVSLALRKVVDAGRYGTIELSDRRIISFKEKSGVAQSGRINAGVYILNRELFLNHTAAGPFSIEKDFFEKQVGTLALHGFQFEGYFIDIGIPEDYEKAQYDFKEFKYR